MYQDPEAEEYKAASAVGVDYQPILQPHCKKNIGW